MVDEAATEVIYIRIPPKLKRELYWAVKKGKRTQWVVEAIRKQLIRDEVMRRAEDAATAARAAGEGSQ
ncbi:MAG: hypothetical protein EXR53_05050 [Dehalococcoidia bacterium]|nr:hypothetical protein [Dehalococcoidia bacterium]